MMPTGPHAYLAGPTVFLQDASRHGELLRSLCRDYGLVGVFPLDDLDSSTNLSARKIFEHNLARLRSCDVVIADISPFRGPHADDGTAFEMGFAHALSLPIFAYSRDCRPLVERIPAKRSLDLKLRDNNGLEIENFGLVQNLMLTCSLAGFHESSRAAIEAAATYLSRVNFKDR